MLRLLFTCICVVVIMPAAASSFAEGIDPNQWGPDIRITRDSIDSYPYAVLNLSDGSLGLIWANIIEHEIDAEILFSSGNASEQWSSPAVMVPAGSDKSWGWYPAATGTNGRLHLAYSDNQPGNWEIFHVYSDDNGATWSAPTRLTDAPNEGWNCTVKTFNEHVYCTWNDNRFGGIWISRPAIYFRSSYDNGITWNEEVRVSDETSDCAQMPRFLVDLNGTLHTVWQNNNLSAEELYYDYSTDSGVTWHQDVPINENDYITSDRPCWVLDQRGNIHLFWVDRLAPGDPGLYYRRSQGDVSEGVKQWTQRQRLANYEPDSASLQSAKTQSSYVYEHGDPQCAIVNGVIHVAWANYLTKVTPGGEVGEAWIHWLYSTDGGETWSQRITVSQVDSISTHLFCIPSHGRLILVWADDRDGNFEVYAKVLLTADVSGDRWVDFLDYAFFADEWMLKDSAGPNDWWGVTDFDNSGDLNWQDMMIFTEQWLRGSE